MKINGKTFTAPATKVFPIIREEETTYFLAKAVDSLDDFDKLCPTPQPPTREVPGRGLIAAVEDPTYKKAVEARQAKVIDYMVVKSLEATPDLEWETVDLNDIDTYKNYEAELKAAGVTAIEIRRLVGIVMEANSLDEEAIEIARESFLTGRRAVETA